ADPGMPLAWKREPYYGALKRMSEFLFRLDRKVLVNLRGQVTVILPDREVVLGAVPPGEDIVVWREGWSYGAALRRDLPRHGAPGMQAAGMQAQPLAGRVGVAEAGPVGDDEAFLKSAFREAGKKNKQL